MKIILMIINFLGMLMLFQGCESEKDPEGVLRGYIDYSFNSGKDRAKYLDWLGEELYEKIKNMSDEEFEDFSNMERFKRKRFRVLQKNCDGELCNITYLITYLQYDENKKADFSVEVRKIGELKKLDGKWKIISVNNIKTYIEAENEIVGPSTSSEAPPPKQE